MDVSNIEKLLLMDWADWMSFILCLFTIMAGIVTIKTLLDNFCKVLNIETPWMRSKREKKEFNQRIISLYDDLKNKENKLEDRHVNDIEQLKELNSEVCNSIVDLKNEFIEFKKATENNELKKNIKKLRWDIIDFASSISDKKEIPIEQYNIIFDRIKEYADLIDKYNLKNGQVDSSVDVIRERYEQDLRNGLLK